MKLAFIELNSIKVQRKHVAICTSGVILSSFSRLLIKWKLVLAILVDVSRGLINFIQSALDTRRSEMFFRAITWLEVYLYIRTVVQRFFTVV